MAPRETIDPARVREWALGLGFDDAGVAPVDLPGEAEHLDTWLEAGYHGSMQWLTRDREFRLDLRRRFPWARSVIVVACAYRPGAGEGTRGIGRFVASYAQGRDYHDVLPERLHALAARIQDALGAEELRSHAYVDTGPTMERALAVAAGLGWQAKNSLLLHEQLGSRFFLGLLITDLDLEPTARAVASCGDCRACQDACPTLAFVEPGVLDARRCISYLTIEHRGEIEESLRPAMGQWLFGCDLCQTCCPFEVRRSERGDPQLRSDGSLDDLSLRQLLELDEDGFRAHLRRSPLWRPRREGLLRNALIVVANGEHYECVDAVRRLLDDDSAVLRETAAWCLRRLERVG